jgi:hypothetical protein
MQLPRPTGAGRLWLGYCLTIAAPAIDWVLEDGGATKIQARTLCLLVLIAGIMLTAAGTMTRPPDRDRR